METELEIFLEGFKEIRESFFCHYSTDFEMLWEGDRTKIREKAALFLKELEIQYGLLVYISRNETLFVNCSPASDYNYFVRCLFLEWCISKGYQTINDLFI